MVDGDGGTMNGAPREGLSREELEQRLALGLALGDEPTVAAMETGIAARLLDERDAAQARRHAERAVALHRRLRSEHDLARALEVLGHAARDLGDSAGATTAYLEAVDLEGRHGHRQAVAALLTNLGSLAAGEGDRDRARELLGAALRTAPEPRDDAARRAELGLARLELEEGDDAAAARRALRVLHGGASGDVALACAGILHEAGMVARRRGDDEAARHRYELALPVLRDQGTPEGLTALLAALGGTCRAVRDVDAAQEYWEETVEVAARSADAAYAAEMRAAALHDLGSMRLHDAADPAAAVRWLEAALGASEGAGSLERSAAVAAELHAAARMLGDRAGMERWREVHRRAAFLAAVARTVEAQVGREGIGTGLEFPTYVYGDTGVQPVAVHIPGGRLSDGYLWRRRLAREVRRAAPLGRLAVVRAGRQVQIGEVPPAAAATAGATGGSTPASTVQHVEVLQMVVVERDGVEQRTATVRRGPAGTTCDRWLASVRHRWLTGPDRLVEALRAALG